jgi:hypothetical protein
VAASSRELAVRLLYIRRPGAGVRRLFTPGGKVGGLVEEARGDIRIRGGHCKFQEGYRLFTEIFFTRHNLVPRFYRYRTRSDYALRRNPFRGNSTKVNFNGEVWPVPGRQSLPRSLPVSLWMK